MQKKLYDKIYGCWLGKNIGGTLGGPYEGQKRLLNLSFYGPVPKEPAPNDDLDLQLVWLDLLLKKGPAITSADLGEAWLKHVSYPCDEYAVATANLKMGLKPPASGYYNNWFQNGMGASIRSEIWAAIAPANPGVAAYYAYQDACVDHYDEGIYGEVFLAALESAAFAPGHCEPCFGRTGVPPVVIRAWQSHLSTIIATGLSFLPENSKVYQVVEFVRNLYTQGKSVSESQEAIVKRFGHFNMTDCVQNIGFIVLGLLYGEGDFGRTILAAVNCGYDTDCTGATSGAVMGIILGAKGIPQEWKAPVGDAIVVGSGIRDIKAPATLAELTEKTMQIGEMVSKVSLKTLPKPSSLPQAKISTPPLHFPFILNGQDEISFSDCHFNLNPYVNSASHSLRLSTFFDNPISRKARILPACNDGLKLWLDNNLALSYHDHKPIRPAPHYPDQSRFVDLDLTKGRHRVDLEINCCQKPLEFSWLISGADYHLLTDLKYSTKEQ